MARKGKFHIGKNGMNSLCKATVRPGGGAVSDCPGVEGSTGGHLTMGGIANSGGGKLYRWDGIVNISDVDKETGLYSISREGGKRVHYYYADTDELVKWKDQRSDERKGIIRRRADNSGPSEEMVEINSETPALFRQWFGDFERLHGVEIKEVNRKNVNDVMELGAAAMTEHMPRSGDEVKDNNKYSAAMKSAMLNLQVFKMSPENAVNAVLRDNYWGPFKKKYRQGR